MTALDKLIEAVEAESWDGSWRWLIDNIWDIDQCKPFSDAYNGSLDAALALHEALLPGWHWSKSALGRFSVFQDRGEWFNATRPAPARAWLLAILRAYRSVQG